MIPTISIAHATRRPKQALAMREVWLNCAANPDSIEYIFGIDEDDAQSRVILADAPHTVSPAGLGSVRAFNDAAARCTGGIIIGGCDDMHPFPGWDEAIIKRIGPITAPAVLLTSDGFRTDRLATLMIVTRAWYEKFGWLCPPQFESLGPDVWVTERASRDGFLINASDLVFEHRHAFYKKAPMDDVYRAQNDPAKHEHTQRVIAELLPPLSISLCMIVGNEAALIQSCLESAAGAFDELCLVRAIGETVPDQTVELARAWCGRAGKPFHFAEYLNSTPGLSHVDNFAAARNLSFSLATTYWQIWLDCDDVLDELNCRRIRECATNTRFEAQHFPYYGDAGAQWNRERLIKRGHGTWQWPVHETCAVRGDGCLVPQVKIVHQQPRGKSSASAARNLAILERTGEISPRHYFYRPQELLALGRRDDAHAANLLAIEKIPVEMECERYEICLDLAELEPIRTEHWCFEAIKIMPQRREAFSQLVQYAVHCGEIQRACQYFRWLDTIPIPDPKPWTHRPVWYGWGRNYLRVLIYRAGGDRANADREHADYLKDQEYAAGVAAHESQSQIATPHIPELARAV